jgi:psp operon transcriptional activator
MTFYWLIKPVETDSAYGDSPYTRQGSDRIPDALGQSEAFLAFQERLSLVAKVDRPVLVVGERGTGKELAVRRLHYLSQRWQGPLVALNCAALSPSVVESELFGHESGAFTGASRRRVGRFESANEGTLFLDEIGLIPLEVQEKILRVVEYGEFERVGGTQSVKVDARLIGATNADLPSLASDAKFKRDLLDRLSFEVLFLPPLRARQEDILYLAQHFGSRMMMELGRGGVLEFTDKAVDKLEGYAWPGNIRELKNVIERAVYKSPDNLIEASEIVFDPFRQAHATGTFKDHNLPGETSTFSPKSTPVQPPPSHNELPCDLQSMVKEMEREYLVKALEASQYKQVEAARLLNLTYHQFRALYRKYKDVINPSS